MLTDTAPAMYGTTIDNLVIKVGDKNSKYTGTKTDDEVVNITAGLTINNLSFADGIEEISDEAFNGTTISNLTLPEGLITIGSNAFKYTLNLKTLTIPSTVTTIGSSAFKNLPSTCVLTVNRSATGMSLGSNWSGNATPTFVE